MELEEQLVIHAPAKSSELYRSEEAAARPFTVRDIASIRGVTVIVVLIEASGGRGAAFCPRTD